MIILCSCFSKSSFFFICAVLSVDAIDMSGKHEVDLDTSIWKVRKFLSFLSFPFPFFFFFLLEIFVFAIKLLGASWNHSKMN